MEGLSKKRIYRPFKILDRHFFWGTPRDVFQVMEGRGLQETTAFAPLNEYTIQDIGGLKYAAANLKENEIWRSDEFSNQNHYLHAA